MNKGLLGQGHAHTRWVGPLLSTTAELTHPSRDRAAHGAANVDSPGLSLQSVGTARQPRSGHGHQGTLTGTVQAGPHLLLSPA